MIMIDNKNYDDWHVSYEGEDDTNSVWHQFVKQNISIQLDLDSSSLLEIACGRGGLANHLSSLSDNIISITACDYSQSAIEIAKSTYDRHDSIITWSMEDIQQLSFQNDAFDTIISCETIEHVPDPQKAILELYRVLKPGGRLFLTCPNYFNFFGLWCLYRYMIGKPYTEGQPYVNYPIYPSILQWIRKAGFEVERKHTSNLVLPLRAHFHFYRDSLPKAISWLGFRTYFILTKPNEH